MCVLGADGVDAAGVCGEACRVEGLGISLIGSSRGGAIGTKVAEPHAVEEHPVAGTVVPVQMDLERSIH